MVLDLLKLSIQNVLRNRISVRDDKNDIYRAIAKAAGNTAIGDVEKLAFGKYAVVKDLPRLAKALQKPLKLVVTSVSKGPNPLETLQHKMETATPTELVGRIKDVDRILPGFSGKVLGAYYHKFTNHPGPDEGRWSELHIRDDLTKLRTAMTEQLQEHYEKLGPRKNAFAGKIYEIAHAKDSSVGGPNWGGEKCFCRLGPILRSLRSSTKNSRSCSSELLPSSSKNYKLSNWSPQWGCQLLDQ